MLTEKFIQFKNLLLTREEWAMGDAPKPKVNDARHKLIKKGQAEIVPQDHWD